MSSSVLVGGGSGFIGTALVNALKQKGYGATVVSRMPGPQSITWHDLANSGLPEKTTAVVSLAGQNVLDPMRRWTAGFKQNVWTSRVNTTAALTAAIARSTHKPDAFVSFSGVGFYPSSKTAEYNEDSDVRGEDFLAHLCHAWEAATLVDGRPPCRTTIIRSGVVMGKQGGMIKNLWLPFYLGVGGPVGDGSQFLPWIHVHDMAQLVIFCIENKNVSGVLNGVAPQVVTNKEFSAALARAMWRPCLFPVPSAILNLAFSEERAKIMTEGPRVIPKRVLEFGFNYKYPNVHEACQAIVNENVVASWIKSRATRREPTRQLKLLEFLP